MGKRFKNVDWSLPESPGQPNVIQSWDHVRVAVLMDIRDELRTLNATLGCFRVRRMCDDINRIDKRLAKHMSLRGKK